MTQEGPITGAGPLYAWPDHYTGLARPLHMRLYNRRSGFDCGTTCISNHICTLYTIFLTVYHYYWRQHTDRKIFKPNINIWCWTGALIKKNNNKMSVWKGPKRNMFFLWIIVVNLLAAKLSFAAPQSIVFVAKYNYF